MSSLLVLLLHHRGLFYERPISDPEKVKIIENCLGRKGLQFIQTVTVTEEEAYQTVKGLFETINEKFKSQFNTIIVSLKCFKL